MHILHLSDLHFSSPSLQTEPILLKDTLIQFINNTFKDEEFYLLLTGDITYKAQKDGFKEAKNFFKDIIRHTHLKQTNIIICPSNHDFQKNSDENPFSAFNQFSKEIRDDNKLTFDISNPNHIIYSHNISLLSINSSYYLDHTFGYIDTDHSHNLLSTNYEQIQQSTYKIAILHHHFLSFDQNDTSMVRNSYQLLNLR